MATFHTVCRPRDTKFRSENVDEKELLAYENSEQYLIDKGTFNDWSWRVNVLEEKLGVHFDQDYQDQANVAAARINALNEYKKNREHPWEQLNNSFTADTDQTLSENFVNMRDNFGNTVYQMYGNSALVYDKAGNPYARYGASDYYISTAPTKGNLLYRNGSEIVYTDGIPYAV